MTQDHDGVRPTKRCLENLEVAVPYIDQPLDEIDNPVVVAAQAIPTRRDLGSVERILSLKDRVWLKVRAGVRRAAVTQLRIADLPGSLPPGMATWWIGAAGRRQADSRKHDFYAALEKECTSGSTVSTDRLLPTEWDWERLRVEKSLAWRREMKRLVIRLIIMSMKRGIVAMADFGHYRIKALVRADNGNESYLAIMTEGVMDPDMFAVLLDCVPGVSPDDWLPEPSPIAEMEPSSGEIIWSTVMPSEVACSLLELEEE
jgi:hypothetical protein